MCAFSNGMFRFQNAHVMNYLHYFIFISDYIQKQESAILYFTRKFKYFTSCLFTRVKSKAQAMQGLMLKLQQKKKKGKLIYATHSINHRHRTLYILSLIQFAKQKITIHYK